MSNVIRSGYNSHLFSRYKDSSIITKELNKNVIKKIIPTIESKLFKNVDIPPRPDHSKFNYDNNSVSNFGDGFVQPFREDDLNMKPLPSIDSMQYPKMSSDEPSLGNVSDLYQRLMEDRKLSEDRPQMNAFSESNDKPEQYQQRMQENGIQPIVENKSNSIPSMTATYNPSTFENIKIPNNANTLPCPEGEVNPPVANFNAQKYNKQLSIQNDDSANFDEKIQNIDNNIETLLSERNARLTQIRNEGFEDGLIEQSKKRDENNEVVSLSAPTKDSIAVLGIDSSLEKGNYIPPKKEEIKDEEPEYVDNSGIEPIDSYTTMKDKPKDGFSLEEKEKLEKRINELEEMYKQKLIVPKSLTNQDDLVESVSYITIDSADRNRSLYPNPHSYTILLDSPNSSHHMGVLKNIVSAKLIGITIPKSKDMEKLRYLYLNVDQFGGPYTGSNKAASDAFARLKFERTFRHRTMGTGAFVSPDLDDVVSSFTGANLNNIDRLTVSFFKPNGTTFTFGTDLATATDGGANAGGSGATISAITSIAISSGGNIKADNVVLTVDDATGLSEGQGIRISGLSATTEVSATDDLNGDHIIKEISGTTVMLETGYTGDAAVNTLQELMF